MTTLFIDDNKIEAEAGSTILEVALENQVYIPHLCYHPGLPVTGELEPYEKIYHGSEKVENGEVRETYECNLCLVEISGREGLFRACTTPVEDGMSIQTDGPVIVKARQGNLASILKTHPHECIVCTMAEGCNRKVCSMDVPVEERCCWKFITCELRMVARYIGVKEGLPPYVPEGLPVLDDNPLFSRDYNLCIGCLRCVRACREFGKTGALGFVHTDNIKMMVGTKAPTLKESGCKYCLACVEVCPTGALRDKKEKRSKTRDEIPPAVLPPEEWLELNEENVFTVPETDGVFRLLNEEKEIVQITGTDNLREALVEELAQDKGACFFDFEEDLMFTSRERQLIQQFLERTGRLPAGNDALDDDLF